jgi:putative hemolysin
MNMQERSPENADLQCVPRRLVDLSANITSPMGRTLFRLLEQPIERLLSLSALNQLYSGISPDAGDSSYFASALRGLGLEYDLTPEDMAKIPVQGPLVIVANHPFGAVDGLILGDILTKIRPDFRLMANQILNGIPELRPWILPVDALGGPQSYARNVSRLRLAIQWLEKGGALGIFPAGTVSHLQLRNGCIADPIWHTTVARLVRRAGATVLTMFFDGHNSMVFQLSGLIHPKLRTALLPSELVKRAHTRVDVRIGRPIEPHKVSRYPDDRTLTSYLRFKTYMLKWRESPIRPRFSPPIGEGYSLPVMVHQASHKHVAEVSRLSAQALLAEQGKFQVFLAAAAEIPLLLAEIGRLRELTFRAVGEGTGQPCDLDRFDGHYQHLFLWNADRQEVVGSYRIGKVDEILKNQGAEGLYTNTLFKLKLGLMERLGSALEMGRSFVRQEYQGQAIPLALLWRGIGEYLVRNPTYKVLFGPVSISKEYEALSRRLMVEFLAKRCGHDMLGSLVKPRNPLRDRLSRQERDALTALVRDADDVSALVSEIETDRKGLPVLLRHYLRLNAFLLSFNLDASFGNCIDGLIVVDLRTSEPKLLRRYMGNAGYESYCRVLGTIPVLSTKMRS